MSASRGTRLAIVVPLSALALVTTGCGRNDFKNDPRPPTPLEVTVEINDNAIKVSPPTFGAGLVNFVIANSSSNPAVFELRGPTQASSDPIPVNGNTVFKIPTQTGSYQVSIKNSAQISPTRIRVGPERASSQNDLLLP
jgi:hypothetical protein